MKEMIPWLRKDKTLSEQKDWLNELWEKPFSNIRSGKYPTVDISEDEKEVKIKAEIPGMSEKDIHLSYNDGILFIKGEKKEEHEEKKKNFFHKESWYGSFYRSIPLGNNLEWEQVKAKYKKGNLTVTIPKKENAESNKIKIEIE